MWLTTDEAREAGKEGLSGQGEASDLEIELNKSSLISFYQETYVLQAVLHDHIQRA